MRISIVGSWTENEKAEEHTAEQNEWKMAGTRQSFEQACRELGDRIVREGHRLVSGGDKPHMADYHAVEGAAHVVHPAPPLVAPVVLLYSNDKRAKFSDWQSKWPSLVTLEFSLEPDWTYAKLFLVKHSDGLIAVGGAQKTFEAGLAAAIGGKLVVPVGSFGGAGRRLNKLFNDSYEQWPRLPSKQLLGQLFSAPWSPHLLAEVTGLISRRKPRLLIIHGRSKDYLTLKNYLQNQLQLPEPTVMWEKYKPGEVLPEKWERVTEDIDAAIALVTPDDVGGLATTGAMDSEMEKRARQNVWLEVGWFWGRLGRARVLLLRREKTVVPSDLHGIEDVEYGTDPPEAGDRIRKFVDAVSQVT